MRQLLSLLPVVEGETVLRVFRTSDLDRFHAYRSDETLALYQGWSPMSVEEARAFVSEMAAVDALRPGDWIQLAIADAEMDRLIGDIGLFLDTGGQIAEIGFTLSRDAQGRGHATRAVLAALRTLYDCAEVDTVRAVTDARNHPSVAVLERAGCTRSAVQHVMFKGAPCTEFVYSHQRSIYPH